MQGLAASLNSRSFMRKRKNQFFRAVCAVLCASIFLSVPLQKAAAVTSDSIKEKEAQIDQAEKEKEALKNSLSDIQGSRRSWRPSGQI